MRKNMLTVLTIVIWMIGIGKTQAENNLQITNEVFQEIEIKSPDGKIEHKRIPATTVIPGTEVFYVITYRNIGSNPADNVAVTNPIPKELEFISASVEKSAANAQVSVDGGKTYDELTRLEVTDSNGKSRAARPSDVSHVRWMLQSSIEPGSKGTVSYRARLK